MPPTSSSPDQEDLEALNTRLRELHDQLRDVHDPDDETLALLRRVQADLHRIEDEEQENDEGILERIEDAAAEFSAEHPMMAQNLRRIVNLLNGMGI